MYEKFPIAFDTITLQTKEKLKFGGNSMNAFEKVIGYKTVKTSLCKSAIWCITRSVTKPWVQECPNGCLITESRSTQESRVCVFWDKNNSKLFFKVLIKGML